MGRTLDPYISWSFSVQTCKIIFLLDNGFMKKKRRNGIITGLIVGGAVASVMSLFFSKQNKTKVKQIIQPEKFSIRNLFRRKSK